MVEKGATMNNEKEIKKPSFVVSITIVAFLFIALLVQVIYQGSADAHMTLMIGTAFGAVLLLLSGMKWKQIEEGILYGCEIATLPMLILMLIGVLIPTLMACGSIPNLIYWGLHIISPKIFLPTVCIVSVIASLATGSSWTSAATFGVAAMGIGIGLGVPAPMTAGAVISGSVVGDKLSPLSDTTNLASGISEVNLFEHIKSMIYTTGPSLLISLVLFAVIGLKYGADSIESSSTEAILEGLRNNYSVTGLGLVLALIPFALILILAFKKVSVIATMVVSALVACAIAMVINGYSAIDMMSFMNYGFAGNSGNADIDALLNRGGLQGMMYTVSLGYFGLGFGGMLEKTGVLEVLLGKMSALTKRQGNLILTHVVSCILVNLLTASQYLSILLTGRLYVPAYDKLGIKRNITSRTCEDAGTVTSPLVPWNMCGVYFATTLGVATLSYLPYAFVAYLSPIIAVIYGYANLFVWKNTPEEQAEIENKKNSTSEII